MPTPPYPELPITRNFTDEMRKAAPEGASGLCLTFLRNSIPASTTFPPLVACRFFAVAPGWHYANQSPTLDISSRSSLSLIYELHSPSPSRCRFSLTLSLRHLLTLTRPEAASPGTKHPRTVKMLQTRRSQGRSGREGYRNDGTRFRPSHCELLSSEPIPADNLSLSGLQSTRVPHEWDFGWIELETSIPGKRQWLGDESKSCFYDDREN